MSTLWTPSGEYRTGDGEGERPARGEGPPGEVDQEALAAELARARAELASTPVVDMVANHAVGLWQLAMLHLLPDPAPDGTPTPPRLGEAALAIDALAGIVDGLGARLAPHDGALRDALSQLRLAYVQVASRESGGDAPRR